MYLPLGVSVEAIFIDLIASSSLPHVGERMTWSHIINIFLQASTERLG